MSKVNLQTYRDNYPSLQQESRKFWQTASDKYTAANEKSMQENRDPWLEEIGFDQNEKDHIAGSGSSSYIFYSPAEDDDGKVAKIFRNNKELEIVEDQLAALHLARENGITKVPEAIALKDNILVMKEMNGVDLNELSPQQIDKISKGQLIELFQTLDSLIKLDLVFDFMPEGLNILYDELEGFKVFDFEINDTGTRAINIPSLQERVDKILKPFFDKQLGIGKLFEDAYAEFLNSSTDE